LKIIGNGQLASAFKEGDIKDTCIFASGVADSSCVDMQAFKREENLLKKTLKEYNNKKFVYFSSSALSVKDYNKNEYYHHKYRMEEIIQNESDNYYIFRLPQLFGELKHHQTLINFLFESIKYEKQFQLFSKGYRYVIELNDVYTLVCSYLVNRPGRLTENLANTYRYSIFELVEIFEKILELKANYVILDKEDGYLLDLNNMSNYIMEQGLELGFGKQYFKDKICKYLHCNRPDDKY